MLLCQAPETLVSADPRAWHAETLVITERFYRSPSLVERSNPFADISTTGYEANSLACQVSNHSAYISSYSVESKVQSYGLEVLET